MVKSSSTYKEIDADHGRVKERLYSVYRDLSFIRASWNWQQLAAIVVVESKRFDKKTQKETTDRRFYITNIRRGHTTLIAKAIRSHWSVENGLHRVLDVVFDEDRSQKRFKNAAENFSRLMRVVMSLLKNDLQRPGHNKPLRRKRKHAAWDTRVLERIILGIEEENC